MTKIHIDPKDWRDHVQRKLSNRSHDGAWFESAHKPARRLSELVCMRGSFPPDDSSRTLASPFRVVMADLHSRSKDRTISRYPLTQGAPVRRNRPRWHRPSWPQHSLSSRSPHILLSFFLSSPSSLSLSSLPLLRPFGQPFLYDKIANISPTRLRYRQQHVPGHRAFIHDRAHSPRPVVSIQSVI